MVKRSLIDQLDAAVAAMMARPDSALPPADPRLAALQGIAAHLRDLPREGFKARLQAELRRRASLATHARPVLERFQEEPVTVKPIREGFHTVTPYLVVSGAAKLMDFVKQAFAAAEVFRMEQSDGGIRHAEVRIGDSMVEMADATAGHPPMPAVIHLYVDDVDAVYRRAIEAGASSMQEPVDQDYGDREAGVKDVCGNHWYIATHQGASAIPEGLRSVTPYLHPRGTDKLIEFLKKAFDAEEAGIYRSPEGTVVHARIGIGDSIVEMGEAHGEFQPMPCLLHLYVNDADAVYRRALEAGATSIQEPADQPYGDRTAGVRDPFGNLWYMATHIKDVAF